MTKVEDLGSGMSFEWRLVLGRGPQVSSGGNGVFEVEVVK